METNGSSRMNARPHRAGPARPTANPRGGFGGALIGLALVLTGCERPAIQEARQLVERYNRVVSEAYRTGDVNRIDPVVGPNEGRKLTGLIGVRLDAGLRLESEMLSLRIVGAEKTGDTMRVRTKEQWKYRDVKVSSGEQVGEESLDSYEMLYVFERTGQAWLVDEIRFTSEPQVGRKLLPFPNGRLSPSHGAAPGPSAQEVKR